MKRQFYLAVGRRFFGGVPSKLVALLRSLGGSRTGGLVDIMRKVFGQFGFDERDYLSANPDVAAAVNDGIFGNGREHFDKYGRYENRPLHPSQRPKSKEEKALTGLNVKGLGLEVGPSHNPVAPKRKGFNVHILDHLNAADLKRKYEGHGVNLDNIEEVDFVWNGEPLSELIGITSFYDWIIASHVIEHIPDLVTFFQQCEALLKPGGKLSLIIPDKRYCFDYFAGVSNTGEILDAWHQKRVRPSPGQVFNMTSSAVHLDNRIAWSPGMTGKFSFGPYDHAVHMWRRAASTDEYIDTHVWRFIPASFDLILYDLRQLGLTSFGVETRFDTTGCEFYAILTKGASALDVVERQHYLKVIHETESL